MQEVKVVLLGDMGVGKSSIALRLVHNQFNANSVTTVGWPRLPTQSLTLCCVAVRCAGLSLSTLVLVRLSFSCGTLRARSATMR